MGVEGLVPGMTYLAPLVLRRTRKQQVGFGKTQFTLGIFLFFFSAKEGKFFFTVALVFHFFIPMWVRNTPAAR